MVTEFEKVLYILRRHKKIKEKKYKIKIIIKNR